MRLKADEFEATIHLEEQRCSVPTVQFGISSLLDERREGTLITQLA
jgi:hypothetical protein